MSEHDADTDETAIDATDARDGDATAGDATVDADDGGDGDDSAVDVADGTDAATIDTADVLVDTDDAAIDDIQARLADAREEVGKRIVGQRDVLEQLFVCILADGNALLESNPGLGKTSMVRTVAAVTDLEFSRIQNTPDLMPSDITGAEIIHESGNTREFVFEEGPVFANVVLADEINRATPKTQAALLEAMQEKQVTAAGETHELPRPFFVLATQNPIDQEGTYPLPEAQTDRFLLKLLVDYPEFDEERDIVDLYTAGAPAPDVDRVLTRTEIRQAQSLVREVPIADDIRDEAIELVRSTREAEDIQFGASPRASMGLVLTAKARAFLQARTHVSWEDVEAMAPAVLRHRILLDFAAEREGRTTDDVVTDLLEQV